MAVAAHSRSGADELLDLVGRQILAGPNGPIRNPLGRRFSQSGDTDTLVAAPATIETDE
jgi:hypothetical protein